MNATLRKRSDSTKMVYLFLSMSLSSHTIMNREITCTVCGETALARPEPIYEGFKKTGEAFVCTACGARYATAEETPFTAGPQASTLFTDADRPTFAALFDDAERQRSCCWCKHLVINPFKQRCGLSNRQTESTDLCEHFEKK